MKRILIAAVATVAIAAPLAVSTASPASADAAHSGRCAPASKWSRVNWGMTPGQVRAAVGVPGQVDSAPQYFGYGYALQVIKYDVCGKWGHGYVYYVQDPDLSPGWHVDDTDLFQYI